MNRTFDYIQAAKQRDARADMCVGGQRIDHLVYALQGLMPEEIKIVEDSTK